MVRLTDEIIEEICKQDTQRQLLLFVGRNTYEKLRAEWFDDHAMLLKELPGAAGGNSPPRFDHLLRNFRTGMYKPTFFLVPLIPLEKGEGWLLVDF